MKLLFIILTLDGNSQLVMRYKCFHQTGNLVQVAIALQDIIVGMSPPRLSSHQRRLKSAAPSRISPLVPNPQSTATVPPTTVLIPTTSHPTMDLAMAL